MSVCVGVEEEVVHFADSVRRKWKPDHAPLRSRGRTSITQLSLRFNTAAIVLILFKDSADKREMLCSLIWTLLYSYISARWSARGGGNWSSVKHDHWLDKDTFCSDPFFFFPPLYLYLPTWPESARINSLNWTLNPYELQIQYQSGAYQWLGGTCPNISVSCEVDFDVIHTPVGCWAPSSHPLSRLLFTEVPNCQSSFGRAGNYYQNNHESKFGPITAYFFWCPSTLRLGQSIMAVSTCRNRRLEWEVIRLSTSSTAKEPLGVVYPLVQEQFPVLWFGTCPIRAQSKCPNKSWQFL